MGQMWEKKGKWKYRIEKNKGKKIIEDNWVF